MKLPRKLSLHEQTVLARALAGAVRTWKPGDACQSFRGTETTTVSEVRGDIIHLADGTSGHRSRMRQPIEETRP